MGAPDACPSCADMGTRQHTFYNSDTVEVVYTCRRCDIQYTVTYGNPFVEVDVP